MWGMAPRDCRRDDRRHHRRTCCARRKRKEQAVSAQQGQAYDAEAYWARRYSTIDITKSGHIDLPAAYNLWLYRRKKERLLQGLQRAGFKAQGASVLEIAAGTGVYVEAWQSLGVRKLVGIDISASATAALQKRFPGYTFYKRDLTEPGLPRLVGRGFGLVTAIDMLYHVVDDAGFPVALANLADALEPGGLLAIHDTFMHGGERDFGYIKLRTLEKYKACLEAAGFEIVSRTPTFFVTVQCHDVESAWASAGLDKLWDRVTNPLIQRFPNIMGCVGYWIDRLLGSVLTEGPAFEMMICRKKTP